MVGIIHVYADMVSEFYGYLFSFFFFLNCLVGCLSMIVWTPAVLGICMCFVFLYLHLFSATEHVSHRKAL